MTDALSEPDCAPSAANSDDRLRSRTGVVWISERESCFCRPRILRTRRAVHHDRLPAHRQDWFV